MKVKHPGLGAVVAYVRWAVEHSDLDAANRTLAVTVASYYSDDEGCARPSWPGLMLATGYPRRTLARRLAAITAAGIWRTETHPKMATRYRFPVGANVHRGATHGTPEPSTGVPPVAPQGCHGWHPNVSNERQGVSSSNAVPRAAWLEEEISYGTWIKRERAAGRQPKHNPARRPLVVDVDTRGRT